MSQANKKSGQYRLSRNKMKVNEVMKVCDAFHRQTEEVWEVHIIDGQIIKQYGMESHLQYNEALLFAVRDQPNIQNIVLIKEIFFKDPETFIVLEKPDARLIEQVNKGVPFKAGEIDHLVCDVATAVLELYRENFYTRSLRPEHIVKVANVWKIESVVMDQTPFPAIECQFVWNPKFSSPEQRERNGRLPEEQIDQQIVWQLGIIGLYAILGSRFKYNQINQDTDIPWPKVEKAASDSLFEFLVGSLRTKYNQRIRLRELFELTLFQDCYIEFESAGFLSHSQFYHAKESGKPKPLCEEDEKLWKNIRQEVNRFKLLGEVQKYAKELPFFKEFDYQLLKFISYRLCHEKLKCIVEKTREWIMGNSIAKNHQLLRSWVNEVEACEKSAKEKSQHYYPYVQGISFLQSSIKQLENIGVTDIRQKQLTHQNNILIYWTIAGYIYTNIARLTHPSEAEHRTICYYSLCAFNTACYEEQKFQVFNQFDEFKQEDGSFNFCRFVAEAPVDDLIRISQQLVKSKFRTCSS